MRILPVLLTACALPGAGCSAFIISSGQHLSELTTQSQVHESFGLPAAAGQTEGGNTFEEFTTHRKIAEPEKGIYLTMGYVCTLGLGEFIWFPHEAWVAERRSIVGQKLRFTYNDAGDVTTIRLDGAPVLLPPRPIDPPETEHDHRRSDGVPRGGL